MLCRVGRKTLTQSISQSSEASHRTKLPSKQACMSPTLSTVINDIVDGM